MADARQYEDVVRLAASAFRQSWRRCSAERPRDDSHSNGRASHPPLIPPASGYYLNGSGGGSRCAVGVPAACFGGVPAARSLS